MTSGVRLKGTELSGGGRGHWEEDDDEDNPK
jgi:hypothetical protein